MKSRAATRTLPRAPRRAGRRLTLWSTTAALLWHSMTVQGAAYLPEGTLADPVPGAPALPVSAPDPDPVVAVPADAASAPAQALPLPAAPANEVEPPPPAVTAADALPEDGIQWTLAPAQTSGRLTLDARRLRLEDGTRVNQQVFFTESDLSTYVWQPWFVQIRGGLGLLLAQDSVRGERVEAGRTDSAALTGRFGLSVFPASRFPFELRADVGDSRTNGDALGSEYRSSRITLTQSYRPPSSSDSYGLTIDHSRLTSDLWGKDTVNAATATAVHYAGNHTLEFTANATENERSDSGDHSRFTTLTGRHSFHPGNSLQIDTLASKTDAQLQSGGFAFDSDTRQISSLATWRPRDGDLLYFPSSPLYVSGSVRLLDGRSSQAASEQHARTSSASLGLSQDVSSTLRLAAGVSGTTLAVDGAESTRTTLGTASATYTPESIALGAWRYSPSLGGSLGTVSSTQLGQRNTVGAQFSHGVSRQALWDDGRALSLTLTQSVGTLRESQTDVNSRTIAHTAGLYWQGSSDARSQSYASASYSDARNEDGVSGRFQMANVQLSQRLQSTRYSSWSGNLTFQRSRSEITFVDALSGTIHEQSPGWQNYYTGNLSYEHQQAFNVQRLRFSLVLSGTSQQFERRLIGDIDAPRERITESLEGRFDYAIGKLETRVSARVARVDGRRVDGVLFRIQRRF